MAGLITQYRRFKKRIYQIEELGKKLDDLQKAIGRVEARQLMIDSKPSAELRDYEFKVYSQWGEDGIIQYLIDHVEIKNDVFVEFGVQDYKESNTRFLLQHNNWSGLVIDASKEDIQNIKKEELYFRNNLIAICEFIDRDNINKIIVEQGIGGDIGLLSIDIDGNDYWIWEAITAVSPRIVICEYDSLLGDERAVTTPYDKNFVRAKAHYSFLYGGASIVAIDQLGKKKGYSLVGSNSAGNNLFLVRNDVRGDLKVVTPKEAYVKAKFRNSHDEQGRLIYLSFEESLQVMRDLPVFDLENNKTVKVADIIRN